MNTYINKVRSFIFSHKLLSTIFLVVILGAGYWGYGKLTSTVGDIRYVTAKVEKGAVVVSISGSGQVSSLNQIDIKPKASGDVVYLPRKGGDVVSKGTLIAQLNTKDAEKSVRDAEINLESARISLEKLKISKSKENLDADLVKSYDDGFNTVSDVFLDLPGIMTGLNDMFFKSNPGTGQWNVDWYEGQVTTDDREQAALFKRNFIDSYKKAEISFDASFDNYKLVSRTADNTTIEVLILQTYNSTKLISDAIKNANNYVDFVDSSINKNNANTPALITTHKSSLSTYTSKTNSHLTALLQIQTNIKNYKDAFLDSDLDIRSSNLSLTQRENALQDAKDKLADYFVRAPFNGTLAIVNIKSGDAVSSSTVIGTLITKNQVAEISLNEVDVAKIKLGQKSTLTFDAIPELSISGVVIDIDAIGTASQGVVTYIAKISFDTQDERIKSGMSVSAAIITDMKEDVLVVPNSAIKKGPGVNGKSYIEKFNTTSVSPDNRMATFTSKITPSRIPVEVGLSNDTETEIISGINEGDEIVTRTIIETGAATTATPSIFGNSSGNRAATPTGAVRFQAR